MTEGSLLIEGKYVCRIVFFSLVCTGYMGSVVHDHTALVHSSWGERRLYVFERSLKPTDRPNCFSSLSALVPFANYYLCLLPFHLTLQVSARCGCDNL